MRLLSRYLLRECLVALAFCFSAFVMFWVAGDLISDMGRMQERKMRGTEIAVYYVFKLPEFLPIAIPVALLLALLYALTNHARHNEITAIRAAGVSLWRISLPYFGLASIAALSLFLINELVAPKAAELASDIWEAKKTGVSREWKKNFFFSNARESRAWHIGVYNRRTSEMIQPAIDWHLPDGSVRSIFADRGVYTNGSWTFLNVRDYRRAAGADSVSVKYQTNILSFPEFTETPEIIRSEIRISERFDADGGTRRADVPLETIRDYLRLHPTPERSMRSWLYTKMHGRFAAPATCLVVVLLAIPFAAGSGRRNVFVGVAASIVIFFAFYIVQQLGFAFAQSGQIPAWFGAWFPNLLAAAVGLWMLARVR